MEKTKLLLICDDLWHPSEVIRRGLASLPESEFEFDIVETAKDILTENMIRRYPMLICCKSNCVNAANTAPWFEDTVTEVGPRELRAYIEEGHGYLAVHSALVYNRRSQPDMADMQGAEFKGHPPRCPVEVKITDMSHPIARGVNGFSERDEHYQLELFHTDARVFLESRSIPGGVQPAGYTRLLGKGRFCALAPGHTLAVWENPEYQRIFINAIRWCLKTEGE